MAKRPNPDLVTYIEKHLAKGFHIKDVKRKLAEVGHPIEAIEDAAQFVLAKQPRKSIPKFMIVYGLILLLLIVAFLYFAWFKASQQVEYKETVAEIQKNQTYSGKTDVELLKMAAAGDMGACRFIRTHNLYYACTGKYWEREDCYFVELIGGDVDSCFFDKAMKQKNISLCYSLTRKSATSCINEVATSNNDYSLCGPDSQCLMNYSIEKDSKDACFAIEDASVTRVCAERLAVHSNDESICAYAGDTCKIHFIKEPAAQVDYVSNVLATKYSGVEFHEGIVPDNRTDFIVSSAFITQNPDLCMKLGDEFVDYNTKLQDVPIRAACLVKVAFLKKDPGVCSRISSERERNICQEVVSDDCKTYDREVCSRLMM
jgi:hypothetical protein